MGFKVNKGRYGRITSVSVGNKAFRVRAGVHGGGVRIGGHDFRSGGGRRIRSSSSRPLSREASAQGAGVWAPQTGGYEVAIDLEDVGVLNLVVDASELTFVRVETIMDAMHAKNVDRATRAFRSFVIEWDAKDSEGNPIPLIPGGVKRIGLEMVVGITAEIVDALGMTPESFGHVITVTSTGKSPRVTVRNRKTGEVTVREGVPKVAEAASDDPMMNHDEQPTQRALASGLSAKNSAGPSKGKSKAAACWEGIATISACGKPGFS